MHIQAQRAVEKTAHRLLSEVAHCGAGPLTRFGVRLGFREEALDFVALLVVGLPLADVDFAVLPVAVMGHRPIQVDAIHGLQRGVLPVPSVEMHKGTRAADDASTWGDLPHQHAVGPHGRCDLAVRIEGDDGTHVRFERAHLCVIPGGSHRTDFLQTEGGVGGNEAGVNVPAVGLDDAVVSRTVHRAGEAHVVDFSIAKTDGCVFQGVSSAQVRRSAQNQNAFLLNGCWRRLGNSCNRHSHTQNEGQ